MTAEVANWLSLLATALVVAASLVGWWTVAGALWPGTVRASAERWQRRPVQTVLVGLLLWLPCLVIAVVPHRPLWAFLVLLWPLLAALTGSAGAALLIGAAQGGDRHLTANGTRAGSLPLALLVLMPGIGWFLMLPLLLAGGLGACLLSALSSPPPEQASPVPPVVPPGPPEEPVRTP